jgi:hypothetical protein
MTQKQEHIEFLTELFVEVINDLFSTGIEILHSSYMERKRIRIHITEDSLRMIPGELMQEDRKCPIYPFEVSKFFAGVKYFALTEHSYIQSVEIAI